MLDGNDEMCELIFGQYKNRFFLTQKSDFTKKHKTISVKSLLKKYLLIRHLPWYYLLPELFQ